MKRYYILLCLFAGLFSVQITAQERKVETKFVPLDKFDPMRNPFDDLILVVEEAKQSNRRILLDVGGEWCIWCHRLDEIIESNQELKDYLHNNFVVLKINVSKENKNEEFLKEYPAVKGYPHLFVLDMNGQFLHSQNTGDLEAGKGHDKNKILGFLKKWSGKSVGESK